jgi:hypothetical protein
MPREILVDWTTPSGSDHRSVFYFDVAAAVAAQRLALSTFLTAVKASLTTVTSYSIEQTGRELDDATGTLTGAWSTGLVYTGTGGSATQPVADATQLLFRWATTTIIGGRFLKGRTYVPGFYAGGLSGGNVLAAQVTGLSAAANTFAVDASHPQVWHRPIAGSGGQAVNMTGGSLWSELAVLRKRRS